MGGTVYDDMTVSEAINYELSGTTVLAKSDNWAMWRNTHGYVGLTYFIAEPYGHGTYVKGVDITAGPHATPPAGIARQYVAAYGGDVEAAGGAYGAERLRAAIGWDVLHRFSSEEV